MSLWKDVESGQGGEEVRWGCLHAFFFSQSRDEQVREACISCLFAVFFMLFITQTFAVFGECLITDCWNVMIMGYSGETTCSQSTLFYSLHACYSTFTEQSSVKDELYLCDIYELYLWCSPLHLICLDGKPTVLLYRSAERLIWSHSAFGVVL